MRSYFGYFFALVGFGFNYSWDSLALMRFGFDIHGTYVVYVHGLCLSFHSLRRVHPVVSTHLVLDTVWLTMTIRHFFEQFTSKLSVNECYSFISFGWLLGIWRFS